MRSVASFGCWKDNNLLATMLLLDFFGPFIVSIAFVLFASRFSFQGKYLWLTLCVATLVGISCIAIIIVAYSSSYGFLLSLVAGVIAVLFSFVMGTITTGVVMFRAKKDKYRKGAANFFLSCIVLPIFCLVPPVGAAMFASECNTLHEATGDVIVRALQSYKRENEKYPENLDVLIPKYMPKLPDAQCFMPYHWRERVRGETISPDYFLEKCPDGTLMLVFSNMGAEWRRYNLLNEHWSISIGDPLDDPNRRICNEPK